MFPLYSFTEHYHVTGDAKTQSYENVRGPFTAIIRRETRIHRFMRTFKFNYRIQT